MNKSCCSPACKHPQATKLYPVPGSGGVRCKYCMEELGYMCSKHPKYQMKAKPNGTCETCWFIWFNKQGREHFGW